MVDDFVVIGSKIDFFLKSVAKFVYDKNNGFIEENDFAEKLYTSILCIRTILIEETYNRKPKWDHQEVIKKFWL